MPLSQSQAEHALAAVRADLPELSGTDPRGKETASVLRRLAEGWPARPNQDDRKDLDVLCREIAVAGNVFKAHDRAWKKGTTGAALPRAYWPLLIAVLLAQAHWADSEDEEARGLALKSLNAGLGVLDIAERSGDVAQLPRLRAWADEILECMSCEAGP